jgi:hypothetical protein
MVGAYANPILARRKITQALTEREIAVRPDATAAITAHLEIEDVQLWITEDAGDLFAVRPPIYIERWSRLQNVAFVYHSGMPA